MVSRVNNFFDDNTHLNSEAIALYVDALKSERVYQLPNVILRHVTDCRECKMEIVEIFSLLQNSDIRDTEPHPFLDPKNVEGGKELTIAFRVAAVLVIGISIVLVSYYLWMLLGEHSGLRGSFAGRDQVQIGTQHFEPAESLAVNKQDIIAENFSVSPNLEDLVNAQSRSASIQVISPPNGKSFKEKIWFQWRADGNERLTLKILSNREKTMHTIPVRGSHYVLSQKIPPGLYYWKLESGNELLYLGKFLVMQ